MNQGAQAGPSPASAAPFLSDVASVSASAARSQARARVSDSLEPLTEVEGALLVVEVLHAPHPEGLGLLLVVGGEHSAAQHTTRLRLGVHRRSSGVGCSRGRLRAHALHCLNLPRDMVRARWIVCCGGRERSTAAPRRARGPRVRRLHTRASPHGGGVHRHARCRGTGARRGARPTHPRARGIDRPARATVHNVPPTYL